MSGPLILIGASVRAAAESARAAGFGPLCFDLFGDLDTRAAAAAWTRVPDFGAETLRRVLELPPSPAVFTGAMESRPAFVDAVAARHAVWGATGASLRGCREPEAVQRAAAAAGLEPLGVSRVRPAGGRWVWKPLASAGGVDFDDPACGRPGFWQRRAEGRPASAFFVDGRLFGHAWQGGGAAADLWADRARPGWADRLAGVVDALGLPGPVGVDVMVEVNGRPRVLEVNPRWTASVELIERLTGRSAAAALAGEWGLVRAAADAACVGKRVVFADAAAVVSVDVRGRFAAGRVADVPPAGAAVAAGDPVCTVFAEGADADSVRVGLGDAAAEVRRGLSACSGDAG